MIPNDRPPEKGNWSAAFNAKALTVGGEVGCLTLIIVILAVFGGIWLDRILGTKPLFTISLVLVSAPLSLVLTYWIAKRAVQDINPSSTAQSSMNNSKEEKTGE
jgi:F0F1-type ATP synthase assembly protein I